MRKSWSVECTLNFREGRKEGDGQDLPHGLVACPSFAGSWVGEWKFWVASRDVCMGRWVHATPTGWEGS